MALCSVWIVKTSCMILISEGPINLFNFKIYLSRVMHDQTELLQLTVIWKFTLLALYTTKHNYSTAILNIIDEVYYFFTIMKADFSSSIIFGIIKMTTLLLCMIKQTLSQNLDPLNLNHSIVLALSPWSNLFFNFILHAISLKRCNNFCRMYDLIIHFVPCICEYR